MESASAAAGPGDRSTFAVSGVMFAVLLALAAPAAHAAGLGEVQVASQLGERLYARVPLIGDGAADVTPECVKLIPESVLQDAPALTNARLSVDRRSNPPAVVVSTAAPVMEPAVRFVLELGCGNRLRREFVLLIDPPDLPAVQTASTAPLPPSARVVPVDESRWGASSGAAAAPLQSAGAPPAFDEPLAEPPVRATEPAPRKAAPKPRPKPAAKPQQAAARTPTPSAPPPPVRAPEAPKAAATDRLVLADSEPSAARPAQEPAKDTAAVQPAAVDAKEEAMTRQIEALTKEVARMREDMDKLAARNRELAKEAENSRTGWFAAAGLGIALAGIGLGLLGRREKKKSWGENLSTADVPDDDSVASRPPLPDVREESRAVAPNAAAAVAAAAVPAAIFHTTAHDISDLDITKIDVQESVGGGTVMPEGSAMTRTSATTMFPSDLSETAFAASEMSKLPLRSLDFSLDDIDLKVPEVTKSPIFSPDSQVSPQENEAARARLFEEIEKAHREGMKR